MQGLKLRQGNKKMMGRSSFGITSLITLLTLTPTVIVAIPEAIAQTAPANQPVLKIAGSSAMATANQAFGQALQKNYPQAQINFQYQGSNAALQALQSGKIDLAAIARPLTTAEKSQGLRTINLAPSKIAIIISKENPFQGSLTDRQFAQIFRGEISNWSQLGGQPGAIRFLDRPLSDTRQAFSKYGVFQKAPLTPGKNSIAIETENVEGAIAKLGKDGVTYAIADRVQNNPNIRIIPMYNTPVTDPRYPFSQTRSYVYQGELSEAAKAFLGLHHTPLTSSSTPTNQPQTSAPPTSQLIASASETKVNNLPWFWWLLPFTFLGGFGLGWLSKGKSQPKQLPPPIPKKKEHQDLPIPPKPSPSPGINNGILIPHGGENSNNHNNHHSPINPPITPSGEELVNSDVALKVPPKEESQTNGVKPKPKPLKEKKLQSQATLWQIGSAHQANPWQKGSWMPSYQYTLHIDPNPVSNPTMPGLLCAAPPEKITNLASAQTIAIAFTLERDYHPGELWLYYNRYESGAEEKILLDDTPLTATNPDQLQWQIPLGAITQGNHILTLQGSRTAGITEIDYLQLLKINV